MNYKLLLNKRPFEAIKRGRKTIEGRTKTSRIKINYDNIKPGDTITFEKVNSREKVNAKVVYVRHYSDVKSMLLTEGKENVLSSKKNIEEGIKSYNRFKGYKENIKRYGIYAIKIKKI